MSYLKKTSQKICHISETRLEMSRSLNSAHMSQSLNLSHSYSRTYQENSNCYIQDFKLTKMSYSLLICYMLYIVLICYISGRLHLGYLLSILFKGE